MAQGPLYLIVAHFHYTSLEDLCVLSKTLFNMFFCPNYRPVHDVKICGLLSKIRHCKADVRDKKPKSCNKLIGYLYYLRTMMINVFQFLARILTLKISGFKPSMEAREFC